MNEKEKETLTPESAPKEAPESAPMQTTVPAGKRSALLRYMVILFAVAFILVLLSLVFQISNTTSIINDLSSSSTGALARAEELQNSNRALQDQLDEANAERDEAVKALEAANTELEAQKETVQQAQQTQADAENRQEAYDALLTVLTAKPVEGDISYAKALQTAQNLREYLSPEAQAILDALTEDD